MKPCARQTPTGGILDPKRTAAAGLLGAALIAVGAGGGAVLAGEAEADFNDLYLGAFRTSIAGDPNYGNLGTGAGLTDPDYNLNTALVTLRAGDLAVPATVSNFISQQQTPIDAGAPGGVSASHANTTRYRRQQVRGVTPLTGNTVWFSFLYSLLGPDSELKVIFNSNVNGVLSDVNSGGVAILAGDDNTPGELAIALPNTGQALAQIPAEERHSGVAWDGAPHVLLGRIDVNDTGPDVVSVWLDPPDALRPGSPALVKTGECVNAAGVTNFALQFVTDAAPGGGSPPTDGALAMVDQLRISDESGALFFVTGNPTPSLPNLVVADDSPSPNFIFGTVFLPTAAADTTNRTVRYVNLGPASMSIQGLSLPDDGDGAFTIVSAPATPFTLNAGQTFEVRIAAGGGGGAGGSVHSGQLLIDTDHAYSDSMDLDRHDGIQATIYTTGDALVLNANPSLDSGQNDWTDGAGGDSVAGIVTGSVQGVRLKGAGDPAGANPDNIGQNLPQGYGDFKVSFWFAVPSFTDYVGWWPAAGDRSMQYIIHADTDIPRDASGVWTNSHADSALVNLGYFPAGAGADSNAGFYVYDGQAASWIRLPALGAILDSLDADRNGILDPAAGDTLNVYRITIAGHGFGRAGASYDISISAANSTGAIATAAGLTAYHAVSIAAQTPGAHNFTTGDVSSDSNPSGATASSFWIDEVFVTLPDTLPVAILNVTPPAAPFRVVEGASASQSLILSNNGIGANLSVTGIGFSNTNFSLASGTVPTSLPWHAAADYSVRFDAAALPGEQVVPVNMAVATANGTGAPTQTVSSVGLVYRTGSPLFNGSFEFAGADAATDSDTFIVWDEQATARRIIDVPGLVTGSTTAAYIDRVESPAVEFGRLDQVLLYETPDFDLDIHFAVKDTANRQFYLQIYGPRSTNARLTFRYQASEGGWHAYTDAAGWQLVMNTTVLAPSVDADGNGSLNDPVDTRNIYRLHIKGRDWDTAGGSYDLQVFNTAGDLVDSATGVAIFREATPMGASRLQFTTEYGFLPGFWIDEISMSGSPVLPPVPVITRFTFDGATRATSLRWLDSGGPFAIAIGTNPPTATATIPVDGDHGVLTTNAPAGELRFDFADPEPAAARRFLWVEDATP